MIFKCKLSQYTSRYKYKGHWIDIMLNTDFEQKEFWYEVTIELPNRGGVITSDYNYPTIDGAEFAAEELIDSWN